ncbi:MAG: ABC transporter substrate-binding protein [Nitrospira sp.]|nr:ABC transporter substrate-binding protein [Nitrospira sp.]MCA9477010.1 ABC transporter substrate-binding protein [Nitrospira sp.]MCB9711558.1 ABC transporter substrate-binding protein [Nitrospiraceae bacterium]
MHIHSSLGSRPSYWTLSVRLVITLLGFVTGLISLPSSLLAEEIAILQSADISAYTEAIEGFKSHLPASAHITLEYNLQGDMAKGRNFAKRIRASDANVVLAVGLKAALAAKLEILDIPVIFCLVLDPEKYGLPAKNMVGLSLDIPFQDHMRPLKILLPTAKRLGVLFDPQKTRGMVDRLTRDATAQGLTIVAKEVITEQEIPKALQALSPNIDALWLLPDSTVLTENSLDFLMSWTLQQNIPVVGFSGGLVKSGALVGAYLHYTDIGHQAATLATTLLKNAQSPVVGTVLMPNQVHQSINEKTATFLGITLPPHILRQFDERF